MSFWGHFCFESLSFNDSRLSYVFLPRASAISSFANPFLFIIPPSNCINHNIKNNLYLKYKMHDFNWYLILYIFNLINSKWQLINHLKSLLVTSRYTSSLLPYFTFLKKQNKSLKGNFSKVWYKIIRMSTITLNKIGNNYGRHYS